MKKLLALFVLFSTFAQADDLCGYSYKNCWVHTGDESFRLKEVKSLEAHHNYWVVGLTLTLVPYFTEGVYINDEHYIGCVLSGGDTEKLLKHLQETLADNLEKDNCKGK